MKATAIAAAAILILAGCSSDKSRSAGDTLQLETATFVDRIYLTGEVEGRNSESITVPQLPQWSTTIQWLAEDGSRVRAGDKVAELDTSTFASQLDDAITRLEESEESLRQKREEARADLAEKELDYFKKKAAWEQAKIDAEIPQEIVSKKEYDERQLELKRTATELEKSETTLGTARFRHEREIESLAIKLEEARRQVGRAENAIETMTLNAPVDGIVIFSTHPWRDKKLEVGDSVWVGFTVARIPDLSSLQVNALLADVDDRRVAVGMPATVTLDAWPDRPVPGVVSSVSSIAEEEGGTSLRRFFNVSIDLREELPEGAKPGLSARVDIETNRIEEALVAPRHAIDFSGVKPLLRLRDGSRTEVEVISCNAMECALEGELEAGALLAATQLEGDGA